MQVAEVLDRKFDYGRMIDDRVFVVVVVVVVID